MSKFDGIIIGGGHNGLTLAAYMSRAGLKVCVLEATRSVGGGCSTDQPTLPGFNSIFTPTFTFPGLTRR